MKVLIDGTLVPASYYYYLLDFRDRHFDHYESVTKIPVTKKMCEYTVAEFLTAFKLCTERAVAELEEIKRSKEHGTIGK